MNTCLQTMDCLQRKMVYQENVREQQHILLTLNLKLCWEKCQERYFGCLSRKKILMSSPNCNNKETLSGLVHVEDKSWNESDKLRFCLVYTLAAIC